MDIFVKFTGRARNWQSGKSNSLYIVMDKKLTISPSQW